MAPRRKDDAAHLHQFVMHAALDFVDERQWETGAMNLKLVDRFNDLLVYAFVTAGGARFLLLHDVRNEENVKNFFHEVHELYLRVALDPFHDARAPSPARCSTPASGASPGDTFRRPHDISARAPIVALEQTLAPDDGSKSSEGPVPRRAIQPAGPITVVAL